MQAPSKHEQHSKSGFKRYALTLLFMLPFVILLITGLIAGSKE